MTDYEVTREYQLREDADWENPAMAGALLVPGQWVRDGEIEPDIVAELVYRGVLAPDGVSTLDAVDDEVIDD